MNKTWVTILSIIAAALLIFPYLGIGSSKQDLNIEHNPPAEVQVSESAIPSAANPADKNKLSEIEDILNN